MFKICLLVFLSCMTVMVVFGQINESDDWIVPGNSDSKSNSGKKWCDLGRDHTMCKYKGPSATCTERTIDRSLSSSAIQAVLDTHNKLRRKVAKGNEVGQPKAANMRKMVYSDDLATVAQRWVDQCTFGHDKNRQRCDGTYVGQNAYMNGWSYKSSFPTTIEEAVVEATQNWYHEVTGWTGGSGSPFTEDMAMSGCGHYTQVVWADSEEVGCGAVQYSDGRWTNNFVVCNYAEGGNRIGQDMYEEGPPASNCPAGYSPDDGLCSKDTPYVIQQCTD